MAVTQISQIQVRTGYLEELGNLAGGEFGWAIDAQRLFIGNGDVVDGAPFPGNTEIMTTNSMNLIEMFASYTFKGLAGGYRVLTGPDAANDVLRTIQDKLDDFVNVKDFGAIGNGIIDDSDAIQRAIYEIYDRYSGETDIITRRAIYFPAGTYRITRSIKIPPYVVLIGDGIDNVKIHQSESTASGCFEFVTTLGLGIDNTNNVGSFAYPTGISIHGMTFSSASDLPGVVIDSSTNCTFNNVGFLGARNRPRLPAITEVPAVLIGSSVSATSSIRFRNCVFSKYIYAVNFMTPIQPISNIVFDTCIFKELAKGIVTVDSSLIYGITASGCKFEYISEQGIYGGQGVNGIQSIGNVFCDVGNDYNGDTGPVTSVIEFNGTQCTSLGDYFCRSVVYSSAVPRINGNNNDILATTIDEGFRLGAAFYKAGHYFDVPNGSSATHNIIGVYKGFIDYVVTRGSTVRAGSIKFVTDKDNITASVVYEDEYSEFGVDMAFDLELDRLTDGTVFVKGTAQAGANSAKVAYDVKTLAADV